MAIYTVDSEAKRLKECSMNARFQKGFEDGLAKIATSLTKKSEPSKGQSQSVVTSATWRLKENVDVNARSGIYFLRTSLQDTEKTLWNSYNTIRNVESTFQKEKICSTQTGLRKYDKYPYMTVQVRASYVLQTHEALTFY